MKQYQILFTNLIQRAESCSGQRHLAVWQKNCPRPKEHILCTSSITFVLWPPFHWLPSPPIVCFCCLCLFLWCVCCLRFLFGWLLPLLRLFCLFIAPDQAVPLAPPHHPPLTIRRFSDDIGEVQFDAHLTSMHITNLTLGQDIKF